MLYGGILSEIEPLDLVMAQVLQVIGLHDLRCYRHFVEFDTSQIFHVFMHCVASFLWQAMFSKSPSICFQGNVLFQESCKLLL